MYIAPLRSGDLLVHRLRIVASGQGKLVMRALGLGVVLSVFWLVLSGHFDIELMTYGAISVALVMFVVVRMRVVDEEGAPLELFGRFAVYFLWLMKETAISNVTVAKLILDPRLPIDPVVLHYRASQKTDLGRVIYANSITLTPGTNTMLVNGTDLEIHSLTSRKDDAEIVEETEMDRWVTWVEQGGRR